MKFEGTKGESCKCFGRKPLVPFLRNSGKSWLVLNYGNHPKERNLRPFLPVFFSVSLQKKWPVDIGKTRTSAISENDSSRLGGSRTVVWRQSRWPCQQDCFHGKIRRKNHPPFFRIPTSKNPHCRRSQIYLHLFMYFFVFLLIYSSAIIIKTYVFMYIKKQKTHTKQWSLKSSHAAKKTRLILAQAPGLLQLKPQILQLRDLLSLTRILHFHWWNIHLRRHCRGLYRSRRLTRLTQRTTRGRFHWRFYRRGLFGRSLKSNGFFFAENSRWPKNLKEKAILFCSLLFCLFSYSICFSKDQINFKKRNVQLICWRTDTSWFHLFISEVPRDEEGTTLPASFSVDQFLAFFWTPDTEQRAKKQGTKNVHDTRMNYIRYLVAIYAIYAYCYQYESIWVVLLLQV